MTWVKRPAGRTVEGHTPLVAVAETEPPMAYRRPAEMRQPIT